VQRKNAVQRWSLTLLKGFYEDQDLEWTCQDQDYLDKLEREKRKRKEEEDVKGGLGKKKKRENLDHDHQWRNDGEKKNENVLKVDPLKGWLW
jgi:hypothetical protein